MQLVDPRGGPIGGAPTASPQFYGTPPWRQDVTDAETIARSYTDEQVADAKQYTDSQIAAGLPSVVDCGGPYDTTGA